MNASLESLCKARKHHLSWILQSWIDVRCVSVQWIFFSARPCENEATISGKAWCFEVHSAWKTADWGSVMSMPWVLIGCHEHVRLMLSRSIWFELIFHCNSESSRATTTWALYLESVTLVSGSLVNSVSVHSSIAFVGIHSYTSIAWPIPTVARGCHSSMSKQQKRYVLDTHSEHQISQLRTFLAMYALRVRECGWK